MPQTNLLVFDLETEVEPGPQAREAHLPNEDV